MPRETQNKILRVLVDQTFQRVGGTTKVAGRRAHHLLDQPQHRSGDRRRQIPRGPLSPPVGRADPRAAAGRAARGHSRCWSTISWTRSRRRPACRKRQIGDDAMAVLQSHDWPGNVRQLRNNVERLMILAGGDPDAVITADMLPPDVGSMVPAMPNGNGGEQLMGLPLREAREVFEREYLRRADQPLRRQHFAHRRIRRHGALGAASQAQGARHRLIATRRSASLTSVADCPMSRIAYVNGRYLPHRDASGPRRGSRLPVRRRRLRGLRGEGRPPGRRAPPHGAPASARSASCASRCRCRARRSASCCARCVRRNRVRDGIVYLQVTRGVARRDHAFPPPGTRAERRRHRPQARSRGNERHGRARASPSSPCRTTAGSASTSSRSRCCPTCWPSRRRASRAPGRPGSSIATGIVTEGLVDQCLDRHRATARW